MLMTNIGNILQVTFPDEPFYSDMLINDSSLQRGRDLPSSAKTLL